MNLNELRDEMLRLSHNLDQALEELVRAARQYAHDEDHYRSAHAKAYLAASGPAHLRRAVADSETSAERYAAHLSEGLKVAALEAVRSRRAQISALQSIANVIKEEAAYGRTGPQ